MKKIIEKAREYQRNYRIIGRAHYIAWEEAVTRNKWLGIPVVITTAAVGTAIFGTIQDNMGIELKIATGLLSLTAAVLSALQTTLKYSELAEKHKMAGARYAGMRRRLEMFILKYEDEPRKQQEAMKALEEIALLFADLAEESPSLPDKIYDRALHEYESSTTQGK